MRALVLLFVLVGAGVSASCDGSTSSGSAAWPTQVLEIRSISPAQGFAYEYTGLRITGQGFRVGAKVSFGGNPALNIVVFGSNELRAAAPLNPIGEADVVVTNPDGQTARLTRGFTFVSRPPPTITRLELNAGATAGGSLVSIFGNDFRNGATATFGGLPAKIYFIDPRELWLAVPRHDAGAVDVVVSNTDGQTAVAAGGYTYGHPTLTDFNGQWNGRIAVEGSEISFSIENDRLVSVKCGGVTHAFVPPPATAGGEFVAVENGRVLVTGAIAFTNYAEGVFSTDACPTVDFWATRGAAMPASRRSRR